MIYFGGCSITMGAGYSAQQQDERIYPNQVGYYLSTLVDNQAEGGSSNLKIFTRAAKALIDKQHTCYFVQWSALHRHWVYPSPKHGFYIGSDVDDNIADRNFVAHYQLLNHDYSNIMSLIDYTRILTQMAKDAGVDIWFINGIVPWTSDMLLASSNRSDYAKTLYQGLSLTEEQDFAERLQNNLELISWDSWINPWNSIAELQVDDAPLDNHPGPETHKKVAEMIVDHIDTHKRK